jgi:hypothetical protein
VVRLYTSCRQLWTLYCEGSARGVGKDARPRAGERPRVYTQLPTATRSGAAASVLGGAPRARGAACYCYYDSAFALYLYLPTLCSGGALML